MITQTQNRAELSEGRQFGLGYSILKKESNNNYSTYLAHTACKDYLNDLVYIERTGLKINNKIYGYKHTRQAIFNKKKYFNLSVCAIDYKGSQQWGKFNECKTLLFENINNTVLLINKLEDFLNLGKLRTSLVDIQEIEGYDNKSAILKVPAYWSKTPILLSLLTLYIRVVFHHKQEISLNDIFSDDFPSFLSEDKYLKKDLNSIINIKNTKKYLNLYEYDLEVKTLNSIHNYGIIGWIKKVNTYLNGLKNIKRCW